MNFCTCQWSVVHSASIDPPYLVRRDPDCPQHGNCPNCGRIIDDGYCDCPPEPEDDDE